MEKTEVTDRESALKYTLEQVKLFGEKYKVDVDINETEPNEYHVAIPAERLKESFELQNELDEMGIDFATGFGFGFRDWELDLSFTYTPKV
jgi:hypothetical protein